MSPRERVYIRMARLLAEGKVVDFWEAATMTGTATRVPDDPNVDKGLGVVLAGPHALLASPPNYQMEVTGQRIDFGTLRVDHPSVAVEDVEDVGPRIMGGEQNVSITSRPSDGTGFRVTIEERGDPARG